MTETVLCIKRKLLPLSWVAEKSIVPLDLQTFVNQCSDSGFCFIDRPTAEKDPSFKQVIPYIILQTSDLKKTAVYKRKGSEKRLHDLWSIGIGGHINPIDMDHKDAEFERVLMTGMERELSEELVKRPEKDYPVFEGIISEEITEVGSVHLGAVFRITTTQPDHYIPGNELLDFAWMLTEELENLNLELWSSLAVELIGLVRA